MSSKPPIKSCFAEEINILEVSTVYHVALCIFEPTKTINWSLSESLFEIAWIADIWFTYIGNSDDGKI